jgi:recombinational DNA repair protein RecR
MTDAVSTKLDSCQNCGEALTGDFCGKCGQRHKESRRAFILLLQETLYTVFELDGRAYKILWYLFTKPAFLSTEYTKGRRASYTPPLRLFW